MLKAPRPICIHRHHYQRSAFAVAFNKGIFLRTFFGILRIARRKHRHGRIHNDRKGVGVVPAAKQKFVHRLYGFLGQNAHADVVPVRPRIIELHFFTSFLINKLFVYRVHYFVQVLVVVQLVALGGNGHIAVIKSVPHKIGVVGDIVLRFRHIHAVLLRRKVYRLLGFKMQPIAVLAFLTFLTGVELCFRTGTAAL